ncbi:dienelactone hydrolase family protein [Nocardioides sp.]|uniref:dienelactone hydrolase family protein n=1 Tax=Nocardioides sp. TaxID=35761 RepID=UPI0039E66A6F
MVSVLLFHHAGGLTPGVESFADRLRDEGHVVEAPDLFDGRRFADVEDGVAYARSVGAEVLAARAAELPAAEVYGGMSMGASRAAEQVLSRPGATGAFFLYGAVAPSWWDATWPAGVPAQAHVTEADPWREPEAEDEFVADVVDGELFIYPGAGHLFAEPGHPDYDEQVAKLATERIVAFLARL